ncbi:family 20 glycosylhydrolase [Arcanobacterium hippocoleae]
MPLYKAIALSLAAVLVTFGLGVFPGFTDSAFADSAPDGVRQDSWTQLAANNIAPKAAVTASGTESGTAKTPDRAVDGIIPQSAEVAAAPKNHNAADASRWSADTTNKPEDKNWIQLDFGGKATVKEIQIYWGNTYGKPYYIAGSLDGKNWSRLGGAEKTFVGVKSGKQTLTLTQAESSAGLRYIKLVTEGKSQKWALSIWEIAVYGEIESALDPEADTVFASLIPYPVKVVQDSEPNAGKFVISADTKIKASGSALDPANFLAQTLSKSTGNDYFVGTESGATTIEYLTDPNLRVAGVEADQMDEAYTISITKEKVTITARNAAGALWGTQTLLQLFGPWTRYTQAAVNALRPIPAAAIEDGPRFSYRGIGLDPARSFIPVAELKSIIAQMSIYKMNLLHLHLTDDPGWRLEIPNDGKHADDPMNYSLLAEKAGKTAFRSGESKFAPEAGRSGFYTLADYAEIVKTANSFGITVVPEMDGPGHMEAALYSIPELNSEFSYPHPCKELQSTRAEDVARYKQIDGECTELTAPIPSYKNNIYTSLDPMNPNTYKFTAQVLKVMAEQSNSPYLHIGGDESAATARDHYTKYLHTVLSQVKALGKRPIIWNDALNTMTAANIDSDTVVQYWNGETAQTRAFAEKGGKIIVSAAAQMYYPQTEDTALAGPNWACGADKECNLREAYQWDPAALLGVPDSAILGVEGVSWSEHLRTLHDLQSAIGNRMIAHAEVGWTKQKNKDWNRFRKAMISAGAASNMQDFSFYLSDQVAWEIQAAVAKGKYRNDAGVNSFSSSQGKALLAYASAPGESTASLRGEITATDAEGKIFNIPVSYELAVQYHQSDGGRTTGRQMNSLFQVFGDFTDIPTGNYSGKLALSSRNLGSFTLNLGSFAVSSQDKVPAEDPAKPDVPAAPANPEQPAGAAEPAVPADHADSAAAKETAEAESAASEASAESAAKTEHSADSAQNSPQDSFGKSQLAKTGAAAAELVAVMIALFGMGIFSSAVLLLSRRNGKAKTE